MEDLVCTVLYCGDKHDFYIQHRGRENSDFEEESEVYIMSNELCNEPMMELFLFESNQHMEQLEQILLRSEQIGSFENGDINEIFSNE